MLSNLSYNGGRHNVGNILMVSSVDTIIAISYQIFRL